MNQASRSKSAARLIRFRRSKRTRDGRRASWPSNCPTALGLDAAERVAFVQAARVERTVDQLALPSQPVEQPQRSSRTNLPAQLTALLVDPGTGAPAVRSARISQAGAAQAGCWRALDQSGFFRCRCPLDDLPPF